LDQLKPTNESRVFNGSSDPQLQSYKAAADVAYSYSKKKLTDQENTLREQPQNPA